MSRRLDEQRRNEAAKARTESETVRNDPVEYSDAGIIKVYSGKKILKELPEDYIIHIPILYFWHDIAKDGVRNVSKSWDKIHDLGKEPKNTTRFTRIDGEIKEIPKEIEEAIKKIEAFLKCCDE